MMNIVAVIVTYNRSEILKKNLQCILGQKGASCDVYVIDNASTDSTREAVSSFSDDRIHYFNTGSNLGGAGGFEFGTRRAVEDGYDLVWLMDDDTLPSSTALFAFLEAGENLEDWGALSSASFWIDGSICKANRQKKTLFTFVSDKELEHHEPVRVKMASFVSLFVKASVVKNIGLPLGEYFIWTDDYEFTGRLSRRYPLYLVPDSRVVHAMKENKKINPALEQSERFERYRYVYRNDVHCYRQFGLSGWLYLAAKFAYSILNVMLNSRDNRLGRIRVIVRGFIEGFSFKPSIKYVKHANGGGATELETLS